MFHRTIRAPIVLSHYFLLFFSLNRRRRFYKSYRNVYESDRAIGANPIRRIVVGSWRDTCDATFGESVEFASIIDRRIHTQREKDRERYRERKRERVRVFEI